MRVKKQIIDDLVAKNYCLGGLGGAGWELMFKIIKLKTGTEI